MIWPAEHLPEEKLATFSHLPAETRKHNYEEVELGMDRDTAMMEAQHIRRLAVLSHDNTMAGLITVDDLARGSHDLAGAVLEAATPIH